MNLEEKIKEIEKLSCTLDEKFIVIITQQLRIENNIFEYKNIVRCDFGEFDIDDEKEYNDLIYKLKKHQKEPDVYTLDEIFEIEHKWYVNYNDSKNNLDRVEYIKKHAKPYKKNITIEHLNFINCKIEGKKNYIVDE